MNGLTQLLSGIDEFQPRKVEELLPNDDIVPDTYLIYPNGGYHPFHGAHNTLPKYQQKIWPYVKRIKFNKRYKSEEARNRARSGKSRKNSDLSQMNPHFRGGYFLINCDLKTGRQRYRGTALSGKGKYEHAKGNKQVSMHRLIALAFIPNPNKKNIVMHINDDSTNYLIENLKWGTQRENSRGRMRRLPDTMEQKYQDLINKGVIKG